MHEAPLEPELYALLKEVAHKQLRRERDGHTLQTTALVHEAWLRLRGDDGTPREAVLARAAATMRHVLVDHARRQLAQRRGARGQRVTLHEDAVSHSPPAEVDLLALDEALARLTSIDERQARIVELRYFAGLTADEIASVLSLSRRTVQGDWNMARAFLRRELAVDQRT